LLFAPASFINFCQAACPLLTTMATSGPSPLFKRKPNWTNDDTLLLLEIIEDKRSVLLGEKGSIPRNVKSAAWDSVAQTINAAFPSHHRTAKDCDKRYRSVKAIERPNISALRKQYAGTGKKILRILDIVYEESNFILYDPKCSKDRQCRSLHSCTVLPLLTPQHFFN